MVAGASLELERTWHVVEATWIKDQLTVVSHPVIPGKG